MTVWTRALERRPEIRLAILGATGDVGRAVATHVLRSGVLHPGDRLLLAGRNTADSRRRLLGISVDMQDAFDDLHVPIEIVSDLQAIEADIVVVAAGETVSAEAPDRRALAARNVALFDRIGMDCAARLPDALFIVVSNPVELAVQRLARWTPRHRVLGMGAQQDSLRFARAIATDLLISRHDVHALVVGEHGAAMVPLWSQARLTAHARERPDLASALKALRVRAGGAPLAERVAALRAEITPLLADGHAERAFAATHAALPDARIFIEPFVTTQCLHSTAQATANATLAILQAALGHTAGAVSAQVALDGESFGFVGVCGLPIGFGQEGWYLDRPDRFDAEAVALIRDSAASIAAFLASVG